MKYKPKQHPSLPKLFVCEDGTVWCEFGFSAGFCKHSAKLSNYAQCAIIEPHLDRYGYAIIACLSAIPARRRKLHRIIAETFIAERELSPKEVVHHKDFNKLNNLPANLEICSIAENNGKPDRTGQKFKRLKPEQQAEAIALFSTHTNQQIAELLSLSLNTIVAARSKRAWQRGWALYEMANQQA